MHVIEQPTAGSVYAESWLIVWSSCWFLISIVGMIAGFVLRSPWPIIVPFLIFILSHGLAIAFAFRFRCPACGRRFLVQGFGHLHAHRRVLAAGVASWIAVAFDIARRRQFICLHCGEKCSVKV